MEMIVTLATNQNSFKKYKNHYKSFFVTSVCLLAEFLHYHDQKKPSANWTKAFFLGKKMQKSSYFEEKNCTGHHPQGDLPTFL
jgi:hypothetical protein